MPLYEYYCVSCARAYELLRPMAEREAPGTCPQGHSGGRRTLSVFAAVARSGGTAGAGGPGAGCGCGGGNCGCGR